MTSGFDKTADSSVPLPAQQEFEEFSLADPVERPRPLVQAELVSTPERIVPKNDERFYFTIADYLIVTFGISIGMAGGTWMHPGIYTLILGIVMLGGMLIYPSYPADSHSMKVAWTTLIVGYLASVVAAVVKYSPIFVE